MSLISTLIDSTGCGLSLERIVDDLGTSRVDLLCMAKFGSFFRRLFTSLVSDEPDAPLSPPHQSRKSIVIISPSTPPATSRKSPTTRLLHSSSRSCSTSPRFAYRTVRKQSTMPLEPAHSPYSYPSNKTKVSNRRLSAPLIIHSSIHLPALRPSAVVDENDEDALISPLQRLSLSSTNGSAAGSANASPRNDVHHSSRNLSPSNSIHVTSSALNTVSSVSGRSNARTRDKRRRKTLTELINAFQWRFEKDEVRFD